MHNPASSCEEKLTALTTLRYVLYPMLDQILRTLFRNLCSLPSGANSLPTLFNDSFHQTSTSAVSRVFSARTIVVNARVNPDLNPKVDPRLFHMSMRNGSSSHVSDKRQNSS